MLGVLALHSARCKPTAFSCRSKKNYLTGLKDGLEKVRTSVLEKLRPSKTHTGAGGGRQVLLPIGGLLLVEHLSILIQIPG
jgi:hypothetical protein